MTLKEFKKKHGWDPERDLDLLLKAEQKYPNDEELKKSELKQQVVIRDFLERIEKDSKNKNKQTSDDINCCGLGKGLNAIFSGNNHEVTRENIERFNKHSFSFKGEYFEKIASDFVIKDQKTNTILMNMIIKLWSNTYSDEDIIILNELMKEFLTKLSWTY